MAIEFRADLAVYLLPEALFLSLSDYHVLRLTEYGPDGASVAPAKLSLSLQLELVRLLLVGVARRLTTARLVGTCFEVYAHTRAQ